MNIKLKRSKGIPSKNIKVLEQNLEEAFNSRSSHFCRNFLSYQLIQWSVIFSVENKKNKKKAGQGQSSDGYLSLAPSRNNTVITSNFTNYSIGKKLCVCIIAWKHYDKRSWGYGQTSSSWQEFLGRLMFNIVYKNNLYTYNLFFW